MGFVNLKIQTEKEKYDELKHRGGSRKQSNELEEGAEPAPFYSIHLQTMCSLFRERQGKREEEEEKKSERETETERQRDRATVNERCCELGRWWVWIFRSLFPLVRCA